MSQTLCRCLIRSLSNQVRINVRCPRSTASPYVSLQSFRHCSSVLSPATPEGQEKEYPNKLKEIVKEISQLTLLEVSDLNELLKKTLKISDSPVMSMGVAPAAPAAQPEEEETAGKKFEQIEFTVNLVKFDESKKVALIKAIKSVMTGMNLVQAKKFVESAPQPLKENITKEEAEQLKKTLEEHGATVEIE